MKYRNQLFIQFQSTKKNKKHKNLNVHVTAVKQCAKAASVRSFFPQTFA